MLFKMEEELTCVPDGLVGHLEQRPQLIVEQVGVLVREAEEVGVELVDGGHVAGLPGQAHVA